MKTLNYFKILFAILSIGLFTVSCGGDDDDNGDGSNGEGTDPNVSRLENLLTAHDWEQKSHTYYYSDGRSKNDRTISGNISFEKDYKIYIDGEYAGLWDISSENYIYFYWIPVNNYTTVDLLGRLQTGEIEQLDYSQLVVRKHGKQDSDKYVLVNSGSWDNPGGDDDKPVNPTYEEPFVNYMSSDFYRTKIDVTFQITNYRKTHVNRATIYYGEYSASTPCSTEIRGSLIVGHLRNLQPGTKYMVKCKGSGKGGSFTTPEFPVMTLYE